MIDKKGLVIRTVFNNQGWAGRCINPLNDIKCFKCIRGGLYINKGNPIQEDEDGLCKGEPEDYPLFPDDPHWCWEQILCKKYFWGNVMGKWRYVFIGMPVYFVYPELDLSLTLWGRSVIDSIDNGPEKYAPIYFEPFEPLPQQKWIKGLTGEGITGKKWGQLHFRYLDESHENYLSSLVQGKRNPPPKKIVPSVGAYDALMVEFRRDIKEKLEKIAHNEGREVKELIREAVAKLIRERSE
jgi:hypothetical protein